MRVLISVLLMSAILASIVTLPIPAGTTLTQSQISTWVAHFTVGPGGGRLVGTWTAYDGMGDIGPFLLNGTVPKPQPAPGIYNCPLEISWSQTNGTLDRPLAPGPYSLYWAPLCTSAREIVVTQTVRVVPA